VTLDRGELVNIYLLRHGLAEERAPSGPGRDADRRLTPKGKRKVWRVAAAMEALGLRFDAILSSPYVRARETAEIVAEAFNLAGALSFVSALTPGGSHEMLVRALRELKPRPEAVLLVGHEPHLSEFASLLVSGSARGVLVLKKAGLCKLFTDSLTAGRCAVLEYLLTPKQLELMGRD
jgi:phosphohistidine phosphatase